MKEDRTKQKIESLLRRAFDPAARGSEPFSAVKKALSLLGFTKNEELDVDEIVDFFLGVGRPGEKEAAETIDRLQKEVTNLREQLRRYGHGNSAYPKDDGLEATDEECFYQQPKRLLVFVEAMIAKEGNVNFPVIADKTMEFLKSIRQKRLQADYDLSPRQLGWLLKIHRQVRHWVGFAPKGIHIPTIFKEPLIIIPEED